MLESLDVRGMTAKEEDILTSRALLKRGVALSYLMRACISDRLVDPDEMLVGDRNAVLVAIRVGGYGPEYRVDIRCPECDEKVEATFDLSRLPLRMLEERPLQDGRNAFAFTLPLSKREVVFTLLTGKTSHDVDLTVERLRNALGVDAPDPAASTRLKAQVVSLAGETDRKRIDALVGSMPAFDSRALREFIDHVSPGVDMVQEHGCPKCGALSEVDVPLGVEFFWPSARR